MRYRIVPQSPTEYTVEYAFIESDGKPLWNRGLRYTSYSSYEEALKHVNFMKEYERKAQELIDWQKRNQPIEV